MSIEKHSCYEFEIKKDAIEDGYIYVIYDTYYVPSDHTIIRESNEWYDTEQEARFAAIGHISLLENGEG